MDARQERGLEIASLLKITRDGDTWIVPSQSGNGRYRVRLTPDATCTCPDFEKRCGRCKHIFAAEEAAREQADPLRQITRLATMEPAAPVPDTPRAVVSELPPPKRPTYKQEWPAYNEAQTNEKDRFQELLHDLCRNIEEPPRQPRRGRPSMLTADAVFSAAFKVYSTFSGRRFMSDLRAAHEKGYISAVPHFNSIFNHLERPALTPVLTAMIHDSGRPLKAVESCFAPDSTGFATSRFVRWFDHKYGVVKVEHDWVKVHIMCGVKTNIVTAVEIRERDAQDSPILPDLLATTKKSFDVKEVPADKGYASIANADAVAAAGATPFICYKAGHTGKGGGTWEKMFHFFSFQRDEFMQHYHKRSNVESTFSMMKAKFGDAVRSKTDVAMKNEALCKVLCHNICCVIQSIYELGIDPAFRPAPLQKTE
jgi:transposase